MVSPAPVTPDPPSSRSLDEQLRLWRRMGDLDAARRLLAELAGRHPQDRVLQRLAWEHRDFWWRTLAGRRVSLRRRGPDDLDFIRGCWADTGFMARFHRTARPLPDDPARLRELLRNEQAAICSELKALHWTIRSARGAIGLLSIVNLHAAHRRAELLIGLRGDHGPWDGAEAAHLALGFLARHAAIERLTAYFYPDNPFALKSALKLGFQEEGLLRGYLRTPDGRRMDLHVAGLLLDDSFFERSAALRRRLLGDELSPVQASGPADRPPDTR